MRYCTLGIFSFSLIFRFDDQGKLDWIEPGWLLKSTSNAFFWKFLLYKDHISRWIESYLFLKISLVSCFIFLMEVEDNSILK